MSERDPRRPADLEGLSPEQRRELLARLLRAKRAARPATHPLSFAQRRLWFLDRLEGDTPAYHVSQLYHLTGELDAAALGRALARVVERHESLRTVFVEVDGEPRQKVLAARPVPLPVVDVASLPAAAAADAARRAARALVTRAYSLERGPLLRCLLLRLGEDRWQLAIDMHHIVSDVWSIGILSRELGALYAAETGAGAARLEPLRIQYGDFARWQREWLAGERLERLLAYWRERLAGAPPVIEMPTDRPRPAEPSGRGALVSFRVPGELYAGVKALARGASITPFMVLLSIFEVLLSRYSGQRDLCLGMPIANRTRSEVEELIGFFVNTLVLRADLSGRPSVRALLARVAETTLGAFDHQDLPFERLVEELSPRRDLSHHPLFQILFQLQTTAARELELAGLELRREMIDAGHAMFDLSVYLEEGGDGGLAATVQFSSDLYDATTIERMGRHYRTLIAAAVADPERAVTRLEMLPPAERRQMLVTWNPEAPLLGAGRAEGLHELVFERARRSPEAVAIRCGDERMSYRELALRSAALARRLRDLGVGPEVVVAVCAPRRPPLVVALLGVLAAGGAYAPLDPSYPRERLARMLESSAARLVLGTAGSFESLPESDLPRVDLEYELARPLPATERIATPASAASAANLAYLIFTSGSTGHPKPVAIEHRSALALVRWALAVFAPEERLAVLASTSVCFDLSIFELFVPLAGGGRVVLVPSALELAELPAGEAITLINTVPSAMAELVRLAALPASVQVVNLAGEPLPRELVDGVRRQRPAARVLNLYGPSEDTTYSTFEQVPADGAPPTIGRPLPGTRAYLLDGELEPVPPGVAGELYLGGLGLARGYLHRPGRSAERFVPDPFAGESAAEPGARLYRTGDLARFLPDGRLAFLGRRDHQVKVRGFRIELGEIEVALRAHPAVEEAVVGTWAGQGGPRLVAHVGVGESAEEGDETWHARLQRHLRETLPDYMLPSATVALAQLPRTPNGKVDRGALPEPQAVAVIEPGAGGAPRTPLEEVLCGIWSEVLGLPRVPVDAGFFELGGHSLLAAQVVSRLRSALGVDPPLKLLFQAPTIAELARRLEEDRRPAPPPIERRPRERPLPLSFSQERLWFFDRLVEGSAVYNVPGTLRLDGALDRRALARALAALGARHETLRTRFVEVGARPMQLALPVADAPPPLVEIDLARLGPERARRRASEVALAESRRAFDLGTGGGWRLLLLVLGAREHRLLVTFHHILADGWSQTVFFRDLAELYAAALGDRSPVLPPLPVQFADVAAWQREWLAGDVLAAELAFWRERLAGAPAVLELPADRPRPAVQSFRGALVTVEVRAALVAALEGLARRCSASLFMVLLAGFEALLHRVTGARDLSVGVPIANRHRLEVEGLIGFLVNTLVLRSELAPGASFADLLATVRGATLEAYAHQDLPFEKLVEELRPERDLSHSPLFQVMLSLLAKGEAPRIEGLETRVDAIDNGTSKFDLTLHAEHDASGLRWVFEYNRDLFDEVTIERFGTHLLTLLAAAVETPERALADLPLLSAAERAELAAWNSTARAYGAVTCLHRMFEEQAELLPEAIALEVGDELVDYRSLNRMANVLAHRLRAAGVGVDGLVGIYMLRSLEMVVSLLAVLKAGGAYVPLDPDYPAERVETMVEDAGTLLVLTTGDLADGLPAGVAEAWVVDAAELGTAAAGGAAAHDPPSAGEPGSLAYAIYTSGSTGRPKGVMNTHRGIFNRLLWMQEAYRLDRDDRVLQKTPFSFDVSVWEFFWPLITAARLVMARPGGHQDPRYLAEIIQRRRITTVHFVPSMLQVFLEHADVSACRSLRRVIVSGEALPADLALRFGEQSGARLENLYGPTEAAIDVTWWSCAAERARQPVPIGRPIANTRIHVVDGRFSEVPVGTAGELLIGGEGLARGYRGRPALTAERFVPDPFASRPGERLYRSGDEARWTADGVIEFLGRLDFQVKLRGLRIELGEIEAAIVDSEAVRECVVLMREDDPGDQRLIAYWVPAGEPSEPEVIAELRRELRRRLPEYMLPSAFVALERLPLSPNGKVDRRALPRPGGAPARSAAPVPRGGLAARIGEVWREVLKIEEVGLDDSFFDLGGHSLLLLEVQRRLEQVLSEPPTLIELFQYPTVRSLVAFLAPGDEPALAVSPAAAASEEESEVAIVALAGRFPGADGVERLWENLRAGVEGISFFTDAELESSPFSPGDPSSEDFVKAGGVLDDVELFDAGFFGFTPREAEILDPQQRLFLECAWEALESAGIDATRFAGRIGVWAGAGLNSYLQTHLLRRPDTLAENGGYQLMLANDKDFLATRVAYKLGLRGPAVSVQTACSTSLVAVHMACRALRGGECEAALAGGVTVRVPQRTGYLYQPSMIQSPDGHCRAFDARAAGTVSGNGVGVVVLKRLSKALADGDRVLAVIRGSAINNDGAAKVGYTAPGVDGQSEVIAAALADAGVPASSIGYVEAHGTGTELGDPIEVAALERAFRRSSEARGFCALGSVKTNVGHLDAAAGVTGLIKAALALDRGEVPPSLHFERPNPRIDFAASPFYVNAEPLPWPRGGQPRRAGVSSFGIGGTNAHVVLEEAPVREPSSASRPVQLLMLSARTPAALERATERLERHLERELRAAQARGRGAETLADAAFTLHTGRQRFAARRVAICAPAEEAPAILAGREPKRLLTRLAGDAEPEIAFLFPGQGAQYPQMGRALLDSEPTFRRSVERCCEILAGHGVELMELLYPPADADGERAALELRQTRYAQPALFVVGYSLAMLWREWGIEPRSMLGHSLGEWVAATLAGVFELEDALALVAERGRLMQSMPTGAMLSVQLSEPRVGELLAAPAHGELELAAVNAPELCVVSGPHAAVDALAAELADRGVEHRRLHTSHAFHSAAMQPAVERFVEAVRRAPRRPPQLPFVSNVSGTWIEPEEATDPAYWGRQLRSPVRFADGVGALLDGGASALLEIGPGRALSSLVRRCARRRETTAEPLVAACLPAASGAGSEAETLMTALARLWLAGAEVDWRGFYAHERRLRRALPTYPFERQRYWIEPGQETALPSEGKRERIESWFYLPSWRRAASLAPPAEEGDTGPWLIHLDALGVGAALAAELERRGETVTRVGPKGSGCEHEVVVTDAASWRRALAELLEAGKAPRRVVHCGAVDPVPEDRVPGVGEEGSAAALFAGAQPMGLLSLLALGQALGETSELGDVELTVLSSGVHRLDHRDPLEPGKATLVGPCRVLQQEYPAVACRQVDLDRPSSWTSAAAARTLVGELLSRGWAPITAWRGGRRWIETVEPLPLPSPAGTPRALRREGVYLITGGLGGIGLTLARHLAETLKAKLVLVGRSSFPPPEEWIGWLAEHGGAGEACAKIIELQNIQEAGSEILLVRADVADETGMAAAVVLAEERFGRLDGVIHCAGVVGPQAFQPIDALDRARIEEQLHAKAYGTLVLERVLVGRELDFVLVMSSIAGFLGGRFFAAYAAANRAADAIVERRAGGETPWLSVAWDGWRLDEAMGDDEASRLAMTRAEGVEVFRRALDLEPGASAGAPLIVSTGDLEARRRRWLDPERLRAAAPETRASEEVHARPALSTAFVAPQTPAERLLAEIWCRLLGIGEVGVHDDFFELGGHSLLATQLLGRLRRQSDRELTLQSVLEHPTIAEQALLLGELEAATDDRADAAAVRIEPVPRDGELPLSFPQERLWFLFRLDPESTAYSLPAAIHLRGRLRLDVLRRCFLEITRRHEVLRSVIEERDGLPRLRIAPPTERNLPLVDLRGLDAWRREPEVYRLAYCDAERPFDIARGPLVRHTLVRLDRDDHAFIANSHHLVSDGWSGAIFIRELAALYEAFLDGKPSPLPELEIQYADYAHWQRRWLQGEVLDTEIEFWRRRLAGLPPTSLPPTDRPRPADGRAPAGRESFVLPPATTEALRRFCHRRGLTLFVGAMAAFHLLLERATGQEDLGVGTPVANRHRPGTEGLIGMFINTVVIRAELTGDPLFEELVEEVRIATVAAQTHQEVPFEKLVEVLKPERPEGAHPLFQVMLAFNHEPPPEPRLPGLDLSLIDLDSRRDEAVFDLSVGITDAGEVIEGSVQYNRALYDRSTIRRLFRHYRALLASAVADADRRCSELSMLSPGERHQLLVEWRRPLAVDELEGLLSGLDAEAQSALPPAEKELELCLLDRRRRPVAAGAWGEAWLLVPPARAEAWAAALGTIPVAAERLSAAVEDGRQLVRTEVAARWTARGGIDWRHRRESETASTPRSRETGSDPRRRRAEAREVEHLWRRVADRTAKLSDDKRRLLDRWLGGAGAAGSAGSGPIDTVLREEGLLAADEQPSPAAGWTPAATRAERSVAAPGAGASRSRVLIQPRGDRRPFFCVHPVAGDVTAYVELARHLDPQRPFVGLQAPGIDGAEPPLASIEALAERYLAELAEQQPGGPYLLGGWSMGALVALEMAGRLVTGGGVDLLVLIEPSPPFDAPPPANEDALLRRLGEDLERLGEGAERPSEIEGLDREQQLEYFVRRLRRLSPAYASLDAASTAGLFEVYKANLEALGVYRPRPYGGPACVVLAERGGDSAALALESAWRPLLAPGTPFETVPGDHRSLLEQPAVRRLAALLRERLEAACRGRVRA